MRSRLRAAVFAAGALACAALSAAAAGSGEAAGETGYGTLRQVVVTSAPLEQGTSLNSRALKVSTTVRQVPESFVPPDALGLAEEAVGRKLAVSLPAGAYVTASALKAPEAPGRAGGGAPKGTTPVEISVTGAGALAASRAAPGDGVDVIVSGDSAPGPSAGRTYVAASGVRLLGLEEAEAEAGLDPDRWAATLALTRAQALRLIRAESAGAQVRLLAG